MPRKPIGEGPCPTTFEYFLYLLIEMERLVERGCIKWPPGQTDPILQRIAVIAAKVVLASDRHKPDRPN
jgi:hypothetical protein